MLSLFDWLMAQLEQTVTENRVVGVEGVYVGEVNGDEGRTPDGIGVADSRGMAHGTQQHHNQSFNRTKN